MLAKTLLNSYQALSRGDRASPEHKAIRELLHAVELIGLKSGLLDEYPEEEEEPTTESAE